MMALENKHEKIKSDPAETSHGRETKGMKEGMKKQRGKQEVKMGKEKKIYKYILLALQVPMSRFISRILQRYFKDSVS